VRRRPISLLLSVRAVGGGGRRGGVGVRGGRCGAGAGGRVVCGGLVCLGSGQHSCRASHEMKGKVGEDEDEQDRGKRRPPGNGEHARKDIGRSR
jgi:hypothetical protein